MAVYLSIFQMYAQKRYPRSIRNIAGDGRYCLVSKCKTPWRILLFPDATSRQKKIDEWERGHGCCSGDCVGSHELAELNS
jgi:hypothetical protein